MLSRGDMQTRVVTDRTIDTVRRVAQHVVEIEDEGTGKQKMGSHRLLVQEIAEIQLTCCRELNPPRPRALLK